MTFYVPWSHDLTGDFTERDHDAAELNMRAAAARLREIAYASQILDKKAYRNAVAAYREARARLYAVREHMRPNGLRREYEELPHGCPEPDAI